MRQTPLLLVMPFLALPLAGQQVGQQAGSRTEQQAKKDILSPFRDPHEAVDTGNSFFNDLKFLYGLAQSVGPALKHFDDEGRETCADEGWQKAYARVRAGIHNMAAYLAQVLRESGAVEDRRAAAYGSYYVDRVADAVELIAHLPGEPVRAIREENWPRAIAYLRAHLGKDPSLALRIQPFIELLQVDDVRDQAQALWFLRECVALRQDLGVPYLGLAAPALRTLLAAQDKTVLREARAFLRTADPEHRAEPAADADAAALGAWLDAVMHDAFPPIRQISPGLVELYESKDLQELARVGAQALRQKSIGTTASGTTADGTFYRGFKVQRLPEPLDRLALPLEAIITRINGVPVASAEELLEQVHLLAKTRRSMMAEFVHEGRTKAIEYRFK